MTEYGKLAALIRRMHSSSQSAVLSLFYLSLSVPRIFFRMQCNQNQFKKALGFAFFHIDLTLTENMGF